MENDIRQLLNGIKEGTVSVDDALLQLKEKPFEDIGFARVDVHRRLRQGVAEVIYGAGKSAGQISGIINAMRRHGQNSILITRLSEEKYRDISRTEDIQYHPEAGIATIGPGADHDGLGNIVVATGGTSDIAIAEEAAVTAEFLGNDVIRLYDVGVAGLHRLMSSLDTIMSASVVIAVAGMEGALASVIGGLAECPVIAVPTSVGYGASFGGLSALLSMLNSCASGVVTVNIDNGFGAGYTAHMINHPPVLKYREKACDEDTLS